MHYSLHNDSCTCEQLQRRASIVTLISWTVSPYSTNGWLGTASVLAGLETGTASDVFDVDGYYLKAISAQCGTVKYD